MSNSLLSYGLQPDKVAALGILRARILEWVAIPFSRESYQPRDQTHIFHISCLGGQVLYHLNYLGSPYRALSLWYFVTASQTGQDTLYIALFHECRINNFQNILNRLSLNHPLSIFPLLPPKSEEKKHIANVQMDQVYIWIYFMCKHHIIYIYYHMIILTIVKHNISIAI